MLVSSVLSGIHVSIVSQSVDTWMLINQQWDHFETKEDFVVSYHSIFQPLTCGLSWQVHRFVHIIPYEYGIITWDKIHSLFNQYSELEITDFVLCNYSIFSPLLVRAWILSHVIIPYPQTTVLGKSVETWVSEWLVHWFFITVGSNPIGGEILSNLKQSLIAQSLHNQSVSVLI